MRRRVVVTGLGAVTPIGMTVSENWQSLMAAKSGIGPITLFDTSKHVAKIAGEITNYKPENYFPTKELKKIDRFIQFSLIAAEEAFKESGLALAGEDPERMGTCIGVGIGGMGEIQDNSFEVLTNGPRRISPFFIPMTIANLAAGHVSIKYGLKGPNTCITSACSSSAHAVGESARYIERGDVDVMFAGGAEATICAISIAGFSQMRALSTRNDDPKTASRPFDKDRDGFVMGEGAGVLILEELEHAKKRGANIICELVGYGLNADANHITAPAPEGEGGARCVRLALKDAKLNPEDIDYVNAHGTSTPIGDILEVQGMKKVFGDHAYKLAVSSTKSMTGHLLGGAGAVESVFSVLAIRHQVCPPTANLHTPDPQCDLNFVPNEPQPRKVRAALSNSFGFGGTNASLIFKQFAR